MSERYRNSDRSGYSDDDYSDNNRPSVRSKQQERPIARKSDDDSADFDDDNFSASDSRRKDD